MRPYTHTYVYIQKLIISFSKFYTKYKFFKTIPILWYVNNTLSFFSHSLPPTGYLKTRSKPQGSCTGFWRIEKSFRYWIRKTVKKQWFYWFVIVLVFLNTVCVAVEHYGQPPYLSDFLCKSSELIAERETHILSCDCVVVKLS